MNKNALTLVLVTLSDNAVRFISSLILTRILVPEAFALVGIISSLVFILALLSDVGFRTYVLKHEDGESQNFLDNLWTVKIIRGFGLMLAMLCLAYPMSLTLDIDGLFPALLIVAPTFVLGSLGTFAPVVSDRSNKPIKPILLGAAAGLLASIIIVITTLIWKSKWCIVVGQLYAPTFTSLLSYVMFKQVWPKFRLNKSQCIEFWHWSKFVIPSSMLTIVLTQADKFILGKAFTAEALGLYFVALNLASVPINFVVSYARNIITPALAEMKHRDSDGLNAKLYDEKNKILMLCCVGLGLGCGLSDFIINLLYDDRYQGVATFLAVMFVRPLLSVLAYPIESLLVVKGQVRVILMANIYRLIWVLLATYPLYHYYGGIGVVWAFVLAELPAVVYFQLVAKKENALQFRYELSYVVIFAISFIFFRGIQDSFLMR